jgi:hypothetical protein
MSIREVVQPLRALINRVSARTDVTVTTRIVSRGLTSKGVARLARAKLPDELLTLSSYLHALDWRWHLTGQPSLAGRLSLHVPMDVKWQQGAPFPKGSRHLRLVEHGDAGAVFVVERQGAATGCFFAGGPAGAGPVRVADTIEDYLRSGMASAFAWSGSPGLHPSQAALGHLAQAAALRPTVRVTVRGVRPRSRIDVRHEVLTVHSAALGVREFAKALGCDVAGRAGDHARLARVIETVDALPQRSDAEIVAGFDPDEWPLTTALGLRHEGERPSASALRRAIDVVTLGPSQPDGLVELDLVIEPLVDLPRSLSGSLYGLISQALAGRAGSPVAAQLGDVALWDTAVEDDLSIDHRAIVAAVLTPELDRLDWLFRPPQRGALTVLVDARAVAGVKEGDAWSAPAVLA